MRRRVMKRMLVGIDGSSDARAALTWSADLARRGSFELSAARVFVPTQAELSPAINLELHDQQEAELEQLCLTLPSEVEIGSCELLNGDPAAELLWAATRTDTDLLVVGGRGAGGFTHLRIGSVADHLLHRTTVPLAIVPRSAATTTEHIILGVDGSPGSLSAVHWVSELTYAINVDVTAVCAIDAHIAWPRNDEPNGRRRHPTEVIEGWLAPIMDACPSVGIVVEHDTHPVSALLNSLDCHPDVVAVVGARGLGGFRGQRLGGVPLQLMHHAEAAVIIVPVCSVDCERLEA
jgi:nucleotide-binding universal stress UspA family protein